MSDQVTWNEFAEMYAEWFIVNYAAKVQILTFVFNIDTRLYIYIKLYHYSYNTAV